MTRLDTQRVPSKLHTRKSDRKYVRGYDVIPHDIWGDPGGVQPQQVPFALIINEVGPQQFNYGTSEISPHTTWWDFGDGATDNCPAVETVDHTYASAGTYTVTATCHGWTETTVVNTSDPPAVDPRVNNINPTTVNVGGPVTISLSGVGFVAPMLVRCWSMSAYQGEWWATVHNPSYASVDVDTTNWPVGTGGIDVVVDGKFSNQLQFQVVEEHP